METRQRHPLPPHGFYGLLLMRLLGDNLDHQESSYTQILGPRATLGPSLKTENSKAVNRTVQSDRQLRAAYAGIDPSYPTSPGSELRLRAIAKSNTKVVDSSPHYVPSQNQVL
jgi:hypothetical protein